MANSLHHPTIQDLETFARLTGNSTQIPALIHLPAGPRFNRAQAMDVEVLVELRQGMDPLVTFQAGTPNERKVTWGHRVSRVVATGATPCTFVIPPQVRQQQQPPAPAPAQPAAAPAQRRQQANPAPVPIPAPAPVPVPVPAAAPAPQTTTGANNCAPAPPPAKKLHWIWKLLIAVVLILIIGKLLENDHPRSPARTGIDATQTDQPAESRSPAGRPARVVPTTTAHKPQPPVATASGDNLEMGFAPCTPATSGMIACDATVTNTGSEAARFVILSQFPIHGVDHGYASGDAKGDLAPIKRQEIDLLEDSGWRNFAVTLPPGGSASFTVHFANHGLGSTKYSIDLAFEWKDNPGLPFESMTVKDVPFNSN